MLNNYPLLSVIVPVYNTEAFLKKCLDSLLQETYPNMEIIVVNDHSPDNAEAIIEEYVEKYDNIRCVKNEKNEGLFTARLKGFEVAKGDYICSVDSDDFVGVDYHRQLMLRALETSADIVVSKFVVYNVENNTFFYRTYGNYAIENIDLKGKDILLDFFSTEGETSHRWLVWNKVYKKSLWDKCYCDLKKLNTHLIMLEDLIYGCILMSKAKRYVSCDEDTYFYVKHPNSSTGLAGNSRKLFKNLSDQITAFSFLKKYFISEGIYSLIAKNFALIRQKQKRVWESIIKEYNLTANEKLQATELLDQLEGEEKSKEDIKRDDPFFYRQHTPWDNRFEKLKKNVIDPAIQYISFDVFDTLILRPFAKPTDLYEFLKEDFDNLVGSAQIFSFPEIRIKAEQIARRKVLDCKRYEDITLQDIYREISNITGLSEISLNKILEKEKELEIKFSQPRKKIKEIFDLALFCQKHIICITDMYLSKNDIKRILDKNGYQNIERIFVSSEAHLSKGTGNLYTFVLKELGIKASDILHIGDNWNSDILNAKRYGIRTWFVPQSNALFRNKIPDINKGKRRASFDSAILRLPNGNTAKYNYVDSYLGIRCMMGTVSNKIFDHPFLSYEAGSDFNRNPYYIGYYALGLHLFGIVQWLLKLCKERSYKKIHFVARDGYMAMQVYKIISPYFHDVPEINYFYMSRKSLLPLLIKKAEDLYFLPKFSPYKNKTPIEYIELLKPILNPCDDLEKVYMQHKILIDKPFESEEEYRNFVDVLIRISYSQEKNDVYRNIMKEYFSSIIGKDEVMFDIGYSGRAQAILSSLVEYPVNAAYIHYLGDSCDDYSKRFHFQADVYYPYVPTIIGKVRELLQSEKSGSCIGYKLENKTVEPEFESCSYTYHARFVLQKIQEGACDFIRDFMQIFGEYLNILHYQDFELDFSHEYFLHYPKDKDFHMFSVIPFEDDILMGKESKRTISQIWWQDLKWNRLRGSVNFTPIDSVHISCQAKWKKGIYYALFDRDSLKSSIKRRIGHHTLLFKLLKKCYALLKSTYKTVKQIKFIKRQTIFSKKQTEADSIEKKIIGNRLIYSATSEYGILCCLVHKLSYEKNTPADLLISEWRKNKYEILNQLHIFDHVYLSPDIDMRKYSNALNSNLKNYDKNKWKNFEIEYVRKYLQSINIDLSQYNRFIVTNTTMLFSLVLQYYNLPYEAMEEAAGLYSDITLQKETVQASFPILDKWMIQKYNSLNVYKCKGCEKWYINYAAQKKEITLKNTEDFNVINLLNHLNLDERKVILKAFNIIETSFKKAEEESCLILTYPLSNRLGISEKDQIMIYACMADIFSADGASMYIKPHPDDHVDYSVLGRTVNIIPSVYLSELLTYAIGVNFSMALTIVSTSLNNLIDIPRRFIFSKALLSNKEKILSYYILAVLISRLETVKVVYIGSYAELLNNLLISLKSLNQLSFENENFEKETVYIFDFNEGETKIENEITKALSCGCSIISFTKFEGCSVLKISKQPRQGTFLVDLSDDCLYLRSHLEQIRHFSFTKQMHALNIDLITHVENNSKETLS